MGDWAAAEEKARDQRGVITLEQLERLGFKRTAIKWAVGSGRLVRMFFRAYRFPVIPPNDEQRAFVATLLAGEHGALSHATAAALWRLNGFESLKKIHVSVPKGNALELPGDFTVHRTRMPFTPYRLRGLRVMRLARTIVDIAPLVSDERLEIILDDAQHRFTSLPRWLREEIAQHEARSQPGLTRLVRILSLREGVATESPQETRVRRAIRERGLPAPELQFVILDANGFVMRVDFAWPRHKVALHFDSFLWHARRHSFDRDAAQRSRLVALNWLSISLTSTALKSSDWLDQLERTLRHRDPQLGFFPDGIGKMAVATSISPQPSNPSRSLNQ